jgi:hypothetical protein
VTVEGEIIGDIAHGALAARALEPAHGEADQNDKQTHEGVCLNCGTKLVGSHCHKCGQAAHVHRTLGAFFHDLVHGVFHFEGKIWRTLPLLVWNPGQLTREYIEGRRASYVSPIALFLFVVFLSFAVFNAIGNPIQFDPELNSNISEARVNAEKDLNKLEAEKAAAAKQGRVIEGIDGKIEGARAAAEAMGSVEKGMLPDTVASANDEPSFASTSDAINQAWAKAKQNPDLLVYKLQSNAYKFSWLLIPLSVPFVWLLFPFSRRFHLYDHTVFVTYSLSFMLLLTALISLAIVWGLSDWLVIPLIFYAPFHMYRQLHRAYGTSRFGAWWRTWLLSGFALTALALFAVALTMMVATN